MTYPENSTTDVADYTASDTDGDTITWSMAGEDRSRFLIDASGVLTFNGSPNYENPVDSGTDNVYNVTVEVTDGKNSQGNSDNTIDRTINVVITVTNVNERPVVATQIADRTLTVGGTAATISLSDKFSDEDTGDTLRYSASSSDANIATTSVSVSSLSVSLTITPVRTGTATVTVTAYDRPVGVSGGLSVPQNFIVTVQPSAPVGDRLGTVSLSTTSPQVGTTITATLTDPDGSVRNESWSWQRSSDSSAWSNISGATGSSYTVASVDQQKWLRATVSYDDAHGSGKSAVSSAATVEESLTTQVPPTFGEGPSAVRSVPENTAPGIGIGGAVSATDGNSDSLTYFLSGIYAGSFDINSFTGQILTQASLDYETKSTYAVTVEVTDGKDSGGNSNNAIDATISVVITVTNVNESPVVATQIADRTLRVDGTAATISLSDKFSDEDGDTLTYSASSSSTGVATTGVSGSNLTITPVGTGTATITVTAQDPGGLNVSQEDFTVTVQPSAPVGDRPGTVSLSTTEPQVGTTITATLTDPDGGMRNRSWRWQRSSNDSDWSDITGATGSSYKVVKDDRGKWLSASVSYTDGEGPNKSAASSGIQVPPEAPGRVPKPTLTGGDGRLTVDWNAPDDDGGSPITSYQVRYKVSTHPDSPSHWSSAGSVSFATQKTITGLTNGTSYDVQVLACNNVPLCGPWSASATGIAGIKLETPVLDVIPRSGLKALLKWERVSGADSNTRYIVQVREVSASCRNESSCWQEPSPKDNGTDSSPTSDTKHEIDLVDILRDTLRNPTKRGLGDADRYQFRVMATTTPATLNSGYSEIITIIDSPIISINGGSHILTGKAMVRWSPPQGATRYKIRWRKMQGASLPESFLGEETLDDPSRATFPIQPLQHLEVYAIQLNYLTADGWVFSARDRYVWPSPISAGVGERSGERVATFPLDRRLVDEVIDSAGKKHKAYIYHICEETFPDVYFLDRRSKRDAWVKLINHAFGQWQLATDGLVRVVQGTDGCADYSRFIGGIVDSIPSEDFEEGLTEDEIRRHVANYLDKYEERLRGLRDQGSTQSEVLMIDDTEGSDIRLFLDVNVFPEIAKELGFVWSFKTTGRDRENDRAYVTKLPDADRYDMFIRRGAFEQGPPRDDGTGPKYPQDLLRLPGDGDEVAESGEVPFGSCQGLASREEDIHYTAYGTLVHEAGHVLGIAGHPSIEGSVMNGESEPDCSPHPLDIMAIYALYQVE